MRNKGNRLRLIGYCLTIITIFTVPQILLSCTEYSAPSKLSKSDDINNIATLEDIRVFRDYEGRIKIGNCTYIIAKHKKSPGSHSGFGFGMHDGECSNPIHSCPTLHTIDSLNKIIKEINKHI